MRAGPLLAALLCALCPASRAASADPSLLPELDARPRAPKPPPAVRLASPAPPDQEAEPPVEPSAPIELPPLSREERRDSILEPEEPARRPWFVVRERTWFMHGTVDERYGQDDPAFSAASGQGPARSGVSENARLRGVMPVAEAEFAPLSWLALDAEYGIAGVSNPGTGVAAWVDAPRADLVTHGATGATWANPGHAQWWRASFGGASAKTTWQSAGLALRLLESRGGKQGKAEYDRSIDFLAGAHRFRDEFTMTNERVDFNTGQVPAFPPVGSSADGPLYAKTLVWRGPHVGLRAETSLPAGFHLDALFLYSPLMEYRGDIYDVAAAGGAARPQSPNILERAHGTAVHFRIGAAWHWDFVALEAGYMRLYFYSRTGLRRTYAADGSSTDRQLDHAVTERSGLYAGVSFRY